MNEAEGVWAACYLDQGWKLISVYPNEVDALRAAQSYCGDARFLPWGKTLTEVFEGVPRPKP